MYSYGRETRLLPRCKCGRAAPIGKRKCAKCLASPRKVTKGKDVRKGANAVGIASHKPDRSRVRRAKRQGGERMGNKPELKMSNWEFN